MARFDFNPLQTVAPSGQASPEQRINANPRAFGAGIGEAMQEAAGSQRQLAGALENTADVANQHAMAFQELNNETSAKAADNDYQTQLRALGFGANGKPGFFASAGQAAFDGSKPAMEEADKIKNTILDGLPNEAARRVALPSLSARFQSFSNSVSEHGAQGRKEWMLSTSQARQANALANAADFYNDPAKINLNIAVAKGEALSQGELLGHSAEQNQLEQQKVESDIHTAVIDRMMTADPLGAQKYYASHIDGISGAQHTAIEKALKSAVTPVLNANIVKGIMQGAPAPNPAAPDEVAKGPPPAVIAAISKTESGGKDFNSDGSIVTSPKGARGSMQVMPATAVSPGFGVRPSDGSAADDARMGRDYYAAMLARYGNQTVALAAYNWGPGKVDGVLTKMGSAPGQSALIDPVRFASMTPPETREYIAKINNAAPPSAGHMPTSDDVKSNFSAWQQQARAYAEGAYKDNPQAAEQLMSMLEQQSNQIVKGQAFANQAARNTLVAKVNGLVEVPGGGYMQVPLSQRPQTLPDLLKDPASAAAWNDADELTRAGIMARIGKDDNRATEATVAKTHNLKGMAVTDPAGFMAINFASAEYQDALPKADISSLLSMQQKMATKEGHDAIRAQNFNYSMSLAKSVPGFYEAGIPPSLTKTTSAKQREAYNQFGSRLTEQVEDYQAKHKHLPGGDEVRKMAASLLVEATVPGAGFLGMWGRNEPAFKIQVTDAARTQIAAGFQRQYGRQPTGAEVSSIYQAHVLKNGVPK